jgi:hypothetical protein
LVQASFTTKALTVWVLFALKIQIITQNLNIKALTRVLFYMPGMAKNYQAEQKGTAIPN